MTRRSAKLLVHVLGTILGVVTVLLGVGAWRLAQGPIRLDSLVPYLEAAFNERDTGYTVTIGGAELAWGDWQRAFELRALDVDVRRKDGTDVFAAKEVMVEMALPPLARGELRPRGLTVIRPSLTAVRNQDGSLSLSLLEPPSGQGGLTTMSGHDIVDAFLKARDAPPFDYLNEISVLGAHLTIEDHVLGVTWTAPSAELDLRRRGAGLELAAQMTLRNGRDKLDVDMAADYRPGTDRILVSSHLHDFALADLSDLMPRLPSLAGLDVHVDGELTLALDTSFAVKRGSFAMAAAGGHVDLPGVFEAPFDLGPSHASGTILPDLSGVEISGIDLGLGLGHSTGSVTISGFTPDSTVEAKIDIAGLPIDQTGRYWPVELVKNARDWLTSHVSKGVITRATLSLKATLQQLGEEQVPLDSLAVDLDVKDATLEYVKGMPPVNGIDGHVVITGDKLRIDMSGGTLDGLAAARGVVTMDRLDGRKGMLIDVQLSGPLSDALKVATNKTLGLASLVAFDPNNLAGKVDGRLEVVLPRLAGLKRSEVAFRVTSELTDVALVNGIHGYRLDHGTGSLTASNKGADFEGGIQLNGVPLDATYHQSFDASDAVVRSAQLSGQLSDAQRASLGVPDVAAVSGRMGLTLDMAQSADGQTTWSADADLAPTRIVYPLLGINKKPGQPGHAAIEVVDKGSSLLDVPKIEVDVGGMSAAGRGVFHSDNFGLVRLDVQHLAFGRSKLVGAVSVRENGVLDISLDGGTADLEPLFNQITAASGPRLPSFRIKGKLQRVWITDKEAVAGVSIDGTYRDDRWEDLAITGTIGGDKKTPISVSIWRFSPQERRFQFSAADAGDAIRLFGVFNHAEGGSLEVRAKIDDSEPQRPTTGAVRIRNFSLTQAPILTRILSIASLTAIANTLSGKGLEFDSALIPFDKTGDVVKIHDARAFGPGIGITVQGTTNLGSHQLDLKGTLIPFYEINSLLGKLPVIGDLFSGGVKGGGLFAFTYSVTGPRDDPKVAVNPLSVLTPGILRNIFTAPSDSEVDRLTFKPKKR